MFYQKEEEMDKALRFGDVLKGYISVIPKIKEPFLDKLNYDYNLNIELPFFSVALSPCCSIGEKKISLSPLVPVRRTFFDNPYFDGDLTRINLKMKPINAFSPEKWEEKSAVEKADILKNDSVYTLLEFFIYMENDLFPEYPIRKHGETVKIKYYMIDFRNIYRIDCEKIESANKVPLDSKCLQLTVETRAELRDKIAYYFARIPEEDKVLLEE